MSVQLGTSIGKFEQSDGKFKDIKVKSDQGTFDNLDAAKQKAKQTSASPTEDAVIVKEKGQFHVYGTDEITSDTKGNRLLTALKVHDTQPNICNFSVTQRNVKQGTPTNEEFVVPQNTAVRANNDAALNTLAYVSSLGTLGQGIAASNKAEGVSSLARSITALPGVALNRIISPSSIDTPEDVRKIARNTKALGYGNCQEQACVVAQHLKEQGVENVEIVGIKNHAFVVIGRDPMSSLSDPKSWGPASVICDPWYGQVFHPSDIQNKQNNQGKVPDIFPVVTLPN